MPLTSIITSLIPAQNFELIRARIVEILGVEFPAQYAKNNTCPNVTKVWMERFVAFNSETEYPTINVSIQKDNWSNEDGIKSIGTVIYNIDVFANAVTSTGVVADEKAMAIISKMAGMVWAILNYPGYRTLGFDPGIIQETTVKQYHVIDKGSTQDALSSVWGRIQFVVKCFETNVYDEPGVAINELTTTTLLSDENGFFYDYRQRIITPAATGADLTNSFFSNPILEIEILGVDYEIDVDYTQSGTTITATTFEFTNGVNVIAKTF